MYRMHTTFLLLLIVLFGATTHARTTQATSPKPAISKMKRLRLKHSKSAWNSPEYVKIPGLENKKETAVLQPPKPYKSPYNTNEKPGPVIASSGLGMEPEEMDVAQALNDIFAAAALSGGDDLFSGLF